MRYKNYYEIKIIKKKRPLKTIVIYIQLQLHF